MAGKSVVYSFNTVSIGLELTDSIGTLVAATVIDLTAEGFYDKTDNIVFEPMAERFVDDVGPGGELFVSDTQDSSGAVTLNVGDQTPVQKVLAAVQNGQRDEKNLKGITLTVRSRAVGGTGELLYSATGGYFQGVAPRKSFGSRQTVNTYPMRFESVTHDVTE